MKPPPIMLGFVLTFWGWHTDLLPLSIILAFVIEISRFVSIHIEINKENISKLWKLCNVGLVIAGIIAFARNKWTVEAFLILMQWFPLAFTPLIVPVAFKRDHHIDLDDLLLFIKKNSFIKNRSIDIFYPFAVICIASASAANVRDMSFYTGLLIFSIWSLFPLRSKRYTPAFWIFLFILAASSGYAGGVGLNRLQGIVEDAYVDWYVGDNQSDFDISRTRTAMGDVGELKLSGRIVMRVKGSSVRAIDYRLGKTAYNVYKSSEWKAKGARLVPVKQKHEDKSWRLAPGQQTNEMIKVSMTSGTGLIALPSKAVLLKAPESSKLSISRLGAVKIDDSSSPLEYEVLLGTQVTLPSPPNDDDLQIPAKEISSLKLIAAKLDLKSKSPTEIINAVDSFFKQKFTYSLNIDETRQSYTPLADFLLNTRSGHCEYFATASTLLLRTAGISARYNVGYYYDEYSDMEDMFIVRARNAHAWVTAYVDGKWIVVDTTPSSWLEADKKHASLFEPVSDAWSSFTYLFSKWKKEQGNTNINLYFTFLLTLIAPFFIQKLSKGTKLIRSKTKTDDKRTPLYYGNDSPFYGVEKAISSSGNLRRKGETYLEWFRRLEDDKTLQFPEDILKSLLLIHNQLRFDPEGISENKKQQLETEVALLISSHPAKNRI